MTAKTKIIIVEQEALEPWKGKVDLVDAALINHVIVRLTRRKHQKIILYKGQACAWVNYPTVRAENWLIDLGHEALKKRFAKLVDLGLLVRTQLSVTDNGNGKHKGSRAYYGIGPALKARFDDIDSSKTVDNSKTEGYVDTPHSYERYVDTPHYEAPPDTPQSLSSSKSKRVAGGAAQPQSVRPKRPPSAESPPPPNLELERTPEEVTKIVETLSEWKQFRKDRERVAVRKIIREAGIPVEETPPRVSRAGQSPSLFIDKVKAILGGNCENGRIIGSCDG